MTTHVANTKGQLNSIKLQILTTNEMEGILVNSLVVFLFLFVNPIYALFFCAFLNLTSLRINYWVFSFMFTLSFALLFFLKDYSPDNFPNNSDIVFYIQQFKIIHNLSWSEIFYQFISKPHGNEPLFWIYYKVAWILLSGSTILFVFFHYFITFSLIVYIAKIVDANKFVILSLCILLVNFSVFITLFQAWRHTFAFLLLFIGILSFDIKNRKWFPRIMIYSSMLVHISTAIIVIIFEVFTLLTKRKSYKLETIKLHNKEIIGYTLLMALAFFSAVKYGLFLAKRFNFYEAVNIYYQTIITQGTGFDLLNWFTLLICVFLWINQKKMTNADVFIASQYFIFSVLLINLPMPDAFARYNYYIIIGGAILIGKLVATVNFRLGIILLTSLFCYDIYSINYSTELVKTFSERLYSGYLNPAYGLTAMILNYDTILNFKF